MLPVAALMLAIPGAVPADEAQLTVWATGDCVRVDPVTGRYFTDRPDIHADYPTGNYRSRNAIWDAGRDEQERSGRRYPGAGARRVTLKAARNEFVAFQLIVEADRPLKGIQVRLDRLTGPGGAAISGRHLALFKAWYVQVKERSSVFDKLGLGPGWYPDPLVPVAPGDPATLDIPDARNAIGPKQRNQAVWVDIYVPRDRTAAPPGTYRGEARITWPAGETTLAVELEVWDFALPDERHLRGDIWNNSLSRMTPEQELPYYQMFHQHRFQPGVCYYRPRLAVTGTKADGDEQAKPVEIDWKDYDARLGKYIDGSAFTEEHGYWGPGYGVPITHLILPFNSGRGTGGGWPVSVPEGGPTPEYEAVWRETVRQVKAHFEQDPGRRKVGKVVFLGSLDEGYNEETYRKIEYYSRLIASAAGKGWYQFRVDGGHNFATMARLQPYVDLWVMHTFSFNADKMNHFRKLGVEPWFYGDMIYEKVSALSGANTYIDLDLLTCRGPGWAAWYHQAGFCSWEFDYRPERAWTDPANFRHSATGPHQQKGVVFNGSGLLIYRGSFLGRQGPVPTIRLKAHRRGFQDYEYFWLLAQREGGAAADELVRSVILSHPFGNPSHGKTEIWKNDPETWDAVRCEIGRRLGAVHTPGRAEMRSAHPQMRATESPHLRMRTPVP